MKTGKLSIYCEAHKYSFKDKYQILIDNCMAGLIHTGITFQCNLAPRQYRVDIKKAWKKYSTINVDIKVNEECKLLITYDYIAKKKILTVRMILILFGILISLISGPLGGCIIGVAIFYGRFGDPKLVYKTQ